MDIKDRRGIREEAAQALEQASDTPKKLIWIYGLVITGISLLLTLLDFILGHQIGQAEGLSGMDLRTLLETTQMLLQYANMIVMPFLNFGLVYIMIRFVRREQAVKGDLLQGFRRFGTVFLLLLLQMVILNMIAMICLQASALLFMATPMSQPFQELVGPILEQGGEMPTDPAVIGAALGKAMPMVIVFVLLYLAAFIPLTYHFRMAQYLAVDSPRVGAFGCLTGSWKMMRGNCVDMFKLDLGFWWFYVLQAVINVAANLPMILTAAGVELPMSPEGASFLCFGIYLVLNLALIVWAKVRVETTYAVAYDRLRGNYTETNRICDAPQNTLDSGDSQ